MEEIKKTKEIEKGKNILLIAVMFLAAVLLWNTPLLYPVKLFVVALHELSHGLMAIIVGGKIANIQIDYRIGGYCAYYLPLSAGFFSKSLVAAAGYLGSMLWGASIFILSSRSQRDRWITLSIGFIMLVLAFFVIKTGQLFGIVFCFAFAAFLFAAYKWLPAGFHDVFLKFLGLTSCLYVIIDIKEDLIDRSGIGSDADRIAELVGAPSLSVPIGVAWIVLAVVVLFFTFKFAYPAEDPTRVGGQ
ncbi:MAG: M50 family metallopeptidase [Candidatus Aminicenantes bacterium]|nr:M50 family metallopeptidase [Candidatus Aminicenantes bacterium]